MYVAVGKAVLSALFYIVASLIVGAFFHVAADRDDIEWAWFWLAGMVVFSLYVSSGFSF